MLLAACACCRPTDHGRSIRTKIVVAVEAVQSVCGCRLDRAMYALSDKIVHSFIHSFAQNDKYRIRQCVTQCEPDSKAQSRTLTAAL